MVAADQKAGSGLLTPIDKEEDFVEKLCSTGIKVVEVYSPWVGPCVAIHPTLKQLRTVLSDNPSTAEVSVEFLSVPSDQIAELEQFQGKSQPHFLLYQNGHLKETIDGANAPALTKSVTSLAAEAADSQENLDDNPRFVKKREEQVARYNSVTKPSQ
ncbi:hypothetical protein KFL_003070150 [Klebsormidium nitens]|uniref:Thioredoxin domain-containing protein n=1 Tax=Klebsormidium nitens TaxID=105231 RepID=A0A1Y1IDC9_KLENI|nr:hypothetical protein KFL_003070150 [Klebsormidium nitens]|eukprot:GAQ86727.1 hypothetical protein KFL_003070150 [Klebsormidium nitens]